MRSEYLAALGLVLVVACHHDDKGCVEGASVSCACADGASGAQVCNANGTYGACQCETGARGSEPKKQRKDASSITNRQIEEVARGGKTELSIQAPDGEQVVLMASKSRGPETWQATLDVNGSPLAKVDTEAESVIQGVAHHEPIVAVGLVGESVVFVGGNDKLTGKAGFTYNARVFRWDASGKLALVQSTKDESIASDKDFGGPTTSPDPARLYALRIVSSACKEDRAIVGLDKLRVVCSVENQNVKAYMVHVVGTFSTDNFAKRTGQTDIAIPPGKVADAIVEFQNVDLGRSQHPRCECNVTSPDGIPIAR